MLVFCFDAGEGGEKVEKRSVSCEWKRRRAMGKEIERSDILSVSQRGYSSYGDPPKKKITVHFKSRFKKIVRVRETKMFKSRSREAHVSYAFNTKRLTNLLHKERKKCNVVSSLPAAPTACSQMLFPAHLHLRQSPYHRRQFSLLLRRRARSSLLPGASTAMPRRRTQPTITISSSSRPR